MSVTEVVLSLEDSATSEPVLEEDFASGERAYGAKVQALCIQYSCGLTFPDNFAVFVEASQLAQLKEARVFSNGVEL